jgi:AraC-like DNA-binding protein
MPRIAQAFLISRLHSSGLFDRLQSDLRILFRKRLWFRAEGEPIPSSDIHVALKVGAVPLGTMGLKASASEARNAAYQRWLEMAARSFAEELNAPQDHSVGAIPTKIAKAAKMIREQHKEPLSLGDVAGAVDLSRERLSRLFHESLGVGFSEYLNQTRLATARELLTSTEIPITEVAYESGFQSLSQFNRRFKDAEGISPTMHRKRARAPKTIGRVG